MNNKLAFVLGGSGLIGGEVVKQLLDKEKITVINLDIKNKNLSLKKKNKNNEIFFKFDCSDKLDLNIKKVIKKFGLPDFFINCSYPKTSDWENNTFKNVKFSSLVQNIKINLASSCYVTRLIAEACVKNKKKCNIVLLSSIYGLVGQDLSIYKNTDKKENMTYSIIKGGIINFTRQMASHYSKKGLRINNVCPGGVIDNSKLKLKKYKSFLKNYSSRCPMGRLANPAEIASSILFLLSEKSSYITGTSLVVDGGWTVI